MNQDTATVDVILANAKEEGRRLGVSYAGVLTPQEAFALINAGGACIIDVRTHAELQFVGRIAGAIEIEWLSYPDSARNAEFIDQVKQQTPSDADSVLFICRSGVRSHHAAALMSEACGWANCYNVLEGFEGDIDDGGHRNKIGGWRFHQLPWYQT